MGGDEQKPPRVVAGRLGGRCDIPELEADCVSVKPIGVALTEQTKGTVLLVCSLFRVVTCGFL